MGSSPQMHAVPNLKALEVRKVGVRPHPFSCVSQAVAGNHCQYADGSSVSDKNMNVSQRNGGIA